MTRITEENGTELRRGKGKATDPSAPSIRVTPVDPMGGPPKPTPEASARHTKEQVAIEKRLLADMKKAESAELEASIAPRPKRQRRRGRTSTPAVVARNKPF